MEKADSSSRYHPGIQHLEQAGDFANVIGGKYNGFLNFVVGWQR